MIESTVAPGVRVVDADAHITEPPDLWTSRLPRKWADEAPQVVHDPDLDEHVWMVGGQRLSPVAYYSVAGWKDPIPSHPGNLEEADPAGWDPAARLKRLDELGVHSQLLYANIISFDSGAFMALGDELSIACVRAYNDFATEFASADPTRLFPLTVVPFWDREAAITEMVRCKNLGHRGVVFAGKFEQAGLPHFTDEFWDPFYRVAEDLEQSINFHSGFSAAQDVGRDRALAAMSNSLGSAVKGARERVRDLASVLMTPMVTTIVNVLTSGLCDRFPNLNFVSVESGFGYVPYLLEMLDWHWHSYGLAKYSPESLLPSEYFRRQVYGTFWFERSTLPLLELYPDNFMFETDFPHATCLTPGPASPALAPHEHIDTYMAGIEPGLLQKVLRGNAASIYHLD